MDATPEADRQPVRSCNEPLWHPSPTPVFWHAWPPLCPPAPFSLSVNSRWHKTSSVHATPAPGQRHNSKNGGRLCRLLWKQPAASKRPISGLNPQHCQKQASGLHAVIRHDVVCYDQIWTLTQSQARRPKSERVNSINNNVESQVEEWKYPRLQHLTHDYSLTLIITWSKCAPMHIFTCNKFRLERLHSLFLLSGDTAAD